ncbi:MAG TPA: DUF2127 domain-containing protein [Candidatus Xenobia bacterium]|nr:DUF2127 domain-containing protein [Candidatus Xenobia bacterium]
MERPTGVTILAVLEFISAGALILIGLLLLVGGGVLGAMSGGGEGSSFMGVLGALGAVAGIVLIVVSAIPLLVGIGLWKLKNWARVLAIVFSGIGVVSNLFGILGGVSTGEIVSVSSGVIGLGINVLILWYMFQPHVKQAFGAA